MADKEYKDHKISNHLTSESVKVIAESVGIVGLPDDGAQYLAADCTYRVKQLVQVCHRRYCGGGVLLGYSFNMLFTRTWFNRQVSFFDIFCVNSSCYILWSGIPRIVDFVHSSNH